MLGVKLSILIFTAETTVLNIYTVYILAGTYICKHAAHM